MRELFRVLHALLLAIWCGSAMAAGNSLSLGATFNLITAADWLSLALLSAISGLFALLHRVRRSFEAIARQQAGQVFIADDIQTGSWWVFAACHMTGALFVGFLVFMLGEAFDLNSYLEAFCIAGTAWGGAKFADRYADSIATYIESKIPTAKETA